MSETRPAPVVPKWLSRTVVTLLALQVGLLWTHGSLLQRQHDDLQALREDVQALAESLDQDQDPDDGDAAGARARPARAVPRHRGRVRRVAFQQAEAPRDPAADPSDQTAAQELDAARRSGQEAVAQARDAQEKLSISENARKAEAAAQASAGARRTWLWAGAGAVLLVLAGRALLRRRG